MEATEQRSPDGNNDLVGLMLTVLVFYVVCMAAVSFSFGAVIGFIDLIFQPSLFNLPTGWALALVVTASVLAAGLWRLAYIIYQNEDVKNVISRPLSQYYEPYGHGHLNG
jgi:hypothetical protein